MLRSQGSHALRPVEVIWVAGAKERRLLTYFLLNLEWYQAKGHALWRGLGRFFVRFSTVVVTIKKMWISEGVHSETKLFRFKHSVVTVWGTVYIVYAELETKYE